MNQADPAYQVDLHLEDIILVNQAPREHLAHQVVRVGLEAQVDQAALEDPAVLEQEVRFY